MNRAHLSLWAIASAPLILGMHPDDMTPQVVDMVTNPAVIAINQQWCCGNAGVCGYVEIWCACVCVRDIVFSIPVFVVYM